ncbi:MAG: pantetheine-phosphate adenylyltransferase [Actinomycetota bacterium]|nr:pantetheine-phosphate adenylyltransferase [Actinomycetota bacterium]
MERIALCPGTYDPMTKGHLDIINRCSKIFSKVVVAISENPKKKPLYSVERRVDFVKRSLSNLKNIEVITFNGLLVKLASKVNATVVVKGLRAISDFEYEFQMAQINRKLNPEVETVFMVTNPRYAYLSSSAVKEVAMFNGCIRGLVPEKIENDVIESFEKEDFK